MENEIGEVNQEDINVEIRAMENEVGEVNQEDINVEVQALEDHRITITVKVDKVFAAALLVGICSVILGFWLMLNQELRTLKLDHAKEIGFLRQKLADTKKQQLRHLHQIKTLQKLNVSQSESISKMEQTISYLREEVAYYIDYF